MKRLYTFILALFVSIPCIQAQMWNGTDTLFGNEWINYDQTYLKIMIAEDAMYRISRNTLESAGVPVNTISGTKYQLFRMGEETPVYVSTNSIFGTNDYIEFYGEKNRAGLDNYIYANPENELLNTEYSLFTDTSAYFLTWTASSQPTNRFEAFQNDLTNLPDKEQYFIHEKKAVFSSTNIKEAITSGIYYSTYGKGEGFANAFTTSLEVSLAPNHIYTAVNETNVKVRLATSDGTHDLTISLNGNQLIFDQPNGFTFQQYDLNAATSMLTGTDKVLIKGSYDANDKHAVANVILNYPRMFNFDNQSGFQFKIKASSSPLYLEIENFNSGGNNPILYDLTNNLRIVTQLDGNIVKVKLPASTQERTLYLMNNASGSIQAALQTVNFVNYDLQEAQFIIISNKKLFNDGNGNNRVQEYANYRSSLPGGGYTSTVVEIQQLYDQFAYGINRHNIAIRNFGHYIKKEWDNPEYIFIIGKGREYLNVRTNAQLTQSTNATFFVPTFGRPGSDNLLVAGVNTTVPVIPLSRLAVSTPDEIKTYLEKVQTLEGNVNNPQTLDDRLWMKKVLHLGGGGPNEQATIRNHLTAMERTIESNKFGGDVTSFYKNSSDPIQLGDSDKIFETINNGLSIITFFGHAAVGTFDFNIDNPEKYENYGKYPLMFSLGCYSGNIHTNGLGVSERFIFLKDKGAIAFGASVGQGYISSLRTFAEKYYALTGSEEFYGAGIGKLLQETLRNFDNQGNVGIKTLSQQFTLHGDPALRLNPSPGPDYVVDTKSVSFEPNVITAQIDTIIMNFSVANLGFHQEDSIVIELKQLLPNGNEQNLLIDKIPTPFFENKLSYKLPSFGKEAVGLNYFFVKLDVDNEVEELPYPSAENNNELLSGNGTRGIPLFIFDNSAKPVYPMEFGIVNEAIITLKASTSDALASDRKYIMEIDTSQLFNSPIKIKTEIIQPGGVIKWQPTISTTDSTVYYWRVSPDSINPQNSFLWENSSFVYLPNSGKGWNQSHYFQFFSAKDSNTIVIDSSRAFNFLEKKTFFRIKNKLKNSSDPALGSVNNVIWSDFFRWNIPQSMTVVVFHPSGVNNIFGPKYSHLWFNFNPGEYGSVNSNAARIASFPFPTETTEQRENIITFLNDIVPDSAYVVMYTALTSPSNTLDINEWAVDSMAIGEANLFNTMESYGATQIRDLENSGAVPYIFAFRKSVGVIDEQKADDINGVLNFEHPMPANLTEGNFNSIKIGPASSWDKVVWDYSNSAIEDTVSLTIYGNANGQLDSIGVLTSSGEFDISSLNPIQYPFLELKLNAKDEENQTPVQLNKWIVLFEGLPDAAVAANIEYSFQNDTLQQGDEAILRLAIENVTDYNLDSLLLKLTLADQKNQEKVFLSRVAPLEKNESFVSQFNIDTRDLNGFQNLTFEVNPDEDQPERHHFNNYAVTQFFVDRDSKNPLMDVTFDGVHIMDGDIVSPKPNIYISLKDENKYLELSDTSLFKVFIKYPGAYVAENISFQNDWITFFPASSQNLESKNNAYIEFKPVFEEDGEYQLLVQAEDASGNQSGDIDYKVNFEVINKQMISNVLNYPNPFSTSTQFVYTLTGAEIPEYFKIQIMTVSGKIVKEITQDEIGPLKTGTHRTDYRWDGTDEYGAKLANGVYLYRVITKKAYGEDYESYNTGTDSYFQKGFGKMVIMR